MSGSSIGLAGAWTALIFLTNIATFGILAGIGLLAGRAFGVPRRDADWFQAFWVGLAVTIWFLLLWNFLFPVNAAAFWIVLAAGLVGVAGVRPALPLLHSDGRLRIGLTVLLAVAGLWVANVAMGPMVDYDSALYHVQAIKWAREYAVVPGIANLYGPLAFNNASFLYDALIKAGPWGLFAHHVANSSLVYAMMAQCLVAAFGIPGALRDRPWYVFEFLLLGLVVYIVGPELPGFSTDAPTALTLLAAASTLLMLLTARDAGTELRAYWVVAGTMLVTLAVCFKFSTSVFGGAAWILIVGSWLTRERSLLRWRPIRWSAAISCGMLLTWAARGIVQSGYPVFPLTAFAMPVDWRAPLDHASAELAFIVHSGRATAGALGTVPDLERWSVWFPRWLPHLLEAPFEVFLPSCLALAGVFAYVVVRRQSADPPARTAGWAIVVPVFLAIAAWLSAAPEPRYAMHLFWILAALCWTQTLRAASFIVDARRLERWTIVAGAVVAISPAIVDPLLGVAANINPLVAPVHNPLKAVIHQNVTLQPVGQSTRVPVPSLEPFVTNSGLTVNVPASPAGQCFEAPLPCTPNPAPNLRLRVPGALARGFAVDGGWQMLNWPYRWLPHVLPSIRALAAQHR